MAAGLIFIIFVAKISVCISAGLPCPNNCNFKGNCVDQVCECFEGFYGGDCSQIQCPMGLAWFDFATDIDTAHNPAECSNMGICDPTTGTCTCRTGFTGSACERMLCPSSCNGNGQCLSMSTYASQKDPGAGTIYQYNQLWDANLIYGCDCDTGSFGMDCSLRNCPVGDDPLTGTSRDPNGLQYNEKQKMTCTANGGYFTLSFRQQTTDYIYFSDSLATLTAKLGALDTITQSSNGPGIIVQGSDPVCSFTGATIYVTFTQDFGKLPLIVPSYAFLTHSSKVYTAKVSVSSVVAGTKESAPCCNRGTCDSAIGLCTCNDNWDSSNGAGGSGARGDCGFATAVITACPGAIACSLHGICSGSPTYTCTCSLGWTGSDCSQRTCPLSKSWFGYPTADNVAHLVTTECSDMGICSRSAGTCLCASNFYGSACQYLQCPGTAQLCSGNGQCITIGQAAQLSTLNGVIQGYTYGQTPNNRKTWDYDKIYGCFCTRYFDTGYKGYDCSQRICPHGDDPMTAFQYNEIQKISCQAGIDKNNNTFGSFYLTFREATTVEIPHSATASDLVSYLEALATIKDVDVTSDQPTLCPRTPNNIYVEFWVPTGNVPLLEVGSVGVTIFVNNWVTGTKEWAECSNRGICTRNTGQCACFEGMGSSDGRGNVGDRGDCGYILPFLTEQAAG